MASDVTVKSSVLPVRVVVSLRLKTCFLHVWSQKPVRIDSQQVSDVHVLGVLECAFGQCHVIDAEAFHLHRNLCIGISCGSYGRSDEDCLNEFHILRFISFLSTMWRLPITARTVRVYDASSTMCRR